MRILSSPFPQPQSRQWQILSLHIFSNSQTAEGIWRESDRTRRALLRLPEGWNCDLSGRPQWIRMRELVSPSSRNCRYSQATVQLVNERTVPEERCPRLTTSALSFLISTNSSDS